MKNITIDIEAGALALDHTVIAPVSIKDLRQMLASTAIQAEELHPSQEFITFAFEGNINGEAFGINIGYFNYQLDSVWLAWDGGITKEKGYSTSMKELTSDKNKLTEILSRELQKIPDNRTDTHSTFTYNWGHISVAASQISVTVAIGMVWNKYPKIHQQ